MRLRPSAPVWLFCAASLAVLTHRPAIAEQKLILDTGVVELPHGPIMGAEFQTRIPIPKFDWTSPVDYKNGQIYIRFDILARPSLKRFLALQFIQELIGGGSAGEHWWSSGNLRITEPRVYYTEHAIMDMVDATGLKLRLNDPPNLALSLAVQGAGGNPNSIWSDRFIYPMTVRITAVLVSRGATFSGWEAVLGPERPLIRPLGEPHALRDQPIEVTLTTGAQDAQIRYTLDGSEPTASSPLYRAPFVVEPPRTVKARTFKEGLPPSDVSSTNYTPPPIPEVDVVLFADVLDDAWQLDVGRGKLDLKEKREIYQGNAALGVRATFFQLDFHTDELLDPRGYRFLRLAFHPGEDTPSTPFFTVSINNKHLEKVWLLGEQARVGRVDLQRKEWQVVKIPLDFLLNEPIRRIRLEGRLQGTFFFDDLRLVSKGPSPLAAFWEHALPDSVASGTDLHVEATVHLNQFDSVGGSPSLTADLSALGGPGAMPLKTVGTRTYRLDISFIVTTTSGIRPVTINVEQRTAQRLFELHLEHPLVVVPAADRIIFADALASDWNLLASDRTGLDLAGTDQVYSGNAALTLRADTFRMDYRPAEPVDPFGYRFLRFAFHPGEAIARASFFAVIVNGKTGRSVDLLKENSSVSGVDMERKAWQLVEIPLELLTGDPIENIRIEGVLQGTFYLDDMRLVAAKAPSVTAILAEERGRVPPTFVLEQNVPNPFNHATVIRFALPDDAAVNLVVFNLIGQRVATLIDGPHRAGAYALRWDSRGDGGRELASGIYFYCLRTGQQSQVRSLLLLK